MICLLLPFCLTGIFQASQNGIQLPGEPGVKGRSLPEPTSSLKSVRAEWEARLTTMFRGINAPIVFDVPDFGSNTPIYGGKMEDNVGDLEGVATFAQRRLKMIEGAYVVSRVPLQNDLPQGVPSDDQIFGWLDRFSQRNPEKAIVCSTEE